jgi:DNA processing protein
MADELYYQIALTLVPDLGNIRARLLLDHFRTAQAVFKAKKKEIAAVEGIGEACARSVKEWNDFDEAEKEIRFTEQQGIRTLFLTDPAYPQRLLHCYDPPTVLYYTGNADLNTAHIVSIIGTRNHTDYGRQVTEQLVAALQAQQVMVVSGLAFGIDAIAHRSALQHGLPTIGVLGHGLDTLYPMQHRPLSREITAQGALLTEFRRHTLPDKHNFPRRNRIVAGMADATIVIETAHKGGSMITAELAYTYNRDLFAVPGKITDQKSSGCLQLIKQNKAMLYTSPEDLLEILGWVEKKKTVTKKQRALFIELTSEEKTIVDLLSELEAAPIDILYLRSGLSSSTVAAVLLKLELQNIVVSLPGKMYRLC